MINAVHAIVYSKKAEAARAFFKDILQLRHADAGHGWLIFALPPAEIAVHPTDSDEQDGVHELYFVCDNIESTIEELKAKGCEITQPINKQPWGLLTAFRIPAGNEFFLYEPRHASPLLPKP